MRNPDFNPTPPSLLELRDRDQDILRLLLSEHITEFSFEGLRHRLGIHPETLSRALSRLEDHRLIERPKPYIPQPLPTPPFP
jgi:DNA-binding HxlR family transcriptional regulator